MEDITTVIYKKYIESTIYFYCYLYPIYILTDYWIIVSIRHICDNNP